MSWVNERTGKPWKVGDMFWIYDNGKKLIGTIIEIKPSAWFKVEWSDGGFTYESPPNPASDWKPKL